MAAFTFQGPIDSKGRITIPSRIRNKLQLEKGDKLQVQIQSSRIIQQKVKSPEEALSKVRELENVESFSYQGNELKVVLDE